jgi:hypothetical protein
MTRMHVADCCEPAGDGRQAYMGQRFCLPSRHEACSPRSMAIFPSDHVGPRRARATGRSLAGSRIPFSREVKPGSAGWTDPIVVPPASVTSARPYPYRLPKVPTDNGEVVRRRQAEDALRLRFRMVSSRQPIARSSGGNVRPPELDDDGSLDRRQDGVLLLRAHRRVGGLGSTTPFQDGVDVEARLTGEKTDRRLRCFELGSHSRRCVSAAAKDAYHSASSSRQVRVCVCTITRWD